MIFFCDNSGAIFKTVPEKVYQGSVNANVIYFVGAFDGDCEVTAKFTLPNGLYVTERIMPSAYTALTDDIQTENGIKYGVWSLALRSVVTGLSGTVQVQFTVTNANVNGVAATICTALSSFPVEKGVPVLQDDSIDNYETLLTQIKAVLAAIQNGDSENNIASAENAAAAQASATMALAYAEQSEASAAAAQASAAAAQASAEQAKVNAGTKVTVDGVFQETWNADTKVNKITNTDNSVKIYASQGGVDKVYYLAASSGTMTHTNIPQYWQKTTTFDEQTINGVLVSGSPEAGNHVATKNYVDSRTTDRFAQSTLNANKLVGIQPYVDGAYPVYIGGALGGQFSKHSIACYYDLGQGAADVPSQENTVEKMTLYTGTPVRDLQAANKKYVDDKTGLYKTTIEIEDDIAGRTYQLFINTHKFISETNVDLLQLCEILSSSGSDYSGANNFIYEHLKYGGLILFILDVDLSHIDDDGTIWFNYIDSNMVPDYLSINGSSNCIITQKKV